MLKSSLSLLAILIFASACSTVPYNPRRAVKIEKHWYGTTYKQGKNSVNPSTIATKLARKPQYKEKMDDFNSKYKLSQAMGLLGGFAFGWSAGGGFDETGTLIGSILLIGGAIFFDNKASKILSPLVESRNKLVYDYRMIDYKQVIAKKEKRIMVPLFSYKF